MLETAETFYGPRAAARGILLPAGRQAEYWLALCRDDQARATAAGMPFPPMHLEPRSDEVVGSPVPVHVNHGRWLAACPRLGCGDVQYASRNDPRMFCTSCGNDYLDFRWVRLRWPDDVDGIAAALNVRPVPFQNWTGEDVDTLLADNADPANSGVI